MGYQSTCIYIDSVIPTLVHCLSMYLSESDINKKCFFSGTGGNNGGIAHICKKQLLRRLSKVDMGMVKLKKRKCMYVCMYIYRYIYRERFIYIYRYL